MGMEREKKTSLFQELKTSALWILGFVILIWIVELVNGLLGHRLNVLGIRPRTLPGLPGIILYPFLHGGFGHALANTVPFIILGWLVILRGTRTFLQVSAFILVVGGVSIWLFGRTAYHIGASGIIFGYFGFLVARAWYERSMASVLIALVTIILYGGILWGVLPFQAHVAWEGHLFGLLAGALAARLSPHTEHGNMPQP
jgi:membrane associated rhomboid family serine protease